MHAGIRHWFWRKPHSQYATHRSTAEARELGELLGTFGWKVELEKWDGHKHIDIAITQCKVNIEVDGGQHNFDVHQALADLERTYYSFLKGYVTLHIPNVLVRDRSTIELTAQYIDKFLRTSADQLEH
jgi:very-short-patch-repair endonuclease